MAGSKYQKNRMEPWRRWKTFTSSQTDANPVANHCTIMNTYTVLYWRQWNTICYIFWDVGLCHWLIGTYYPMKHHHIPEERPLLHHYESLKTQTFYQLPDASSGTCTSTWSCFYHHLTGEGNAIPLQAWTGPDGSRRLRLSDFMTIGKWRW